MTNTPPDTCLLVPSTYLNVILRNMEPALARRVLADIGLPDLGAEGLQDAVPLAQLQTAIISLRGVMGDDWHVQIIHRLNLFAHGSLGMAAATSPDMNTAISLLERYITIRAPFVRLARRMDGTRCRLQLIDEAGLGEAWRDLLEIVMLGIQSLLEQVRGSRLGGTQMEFAFAPPRYLDSLKQHVQGSVVFDAPEHSFSLPRSWMEQASPMFDLAMHRAALARVEAEFEAAAKQISVVTLVRRALLSSGEQVPGLGEIARSQHIASRTLIRRLKSEGSSYQGILQEVRKQQAIELLSDASLTVKQVSYLLGYKDPSNFGRAFAQWTGKSPGAYRKELRRQ
ncbi:MAG: AraC family transcriptional regulator [Gammaproteobacteria bacterium]|nr:AraC family transcriptional regulator [Gammaproteobacteria bacterium]